MATRKLDNSEWRSFFEAVSEMLGPKRAEIEVLSLKLGDQIEAERLPLLSIVYDPHDDIIEVALEGLDHIIDRPREVYVTDEGAGALLVIEIADAEDVREIVKLMEPLLFPAPQH